MKQRFAGVLALAWVGLISSSAGAQEDDEGRPERPHVWRVSARASTVYYPDADQGLNPVPNAYNTNALGNLVPVNQPPFEAVFGTRHRLLMEGEFERDLWQGFGSVGIGAGVSYAEFYGTGYHQVGDSSDPIYLKSSDGTGFHLVTAKLFAFYRFDYFVPDGIPIVPFVKGGLDWVVYWEQLSSGAITAGTNGNAIGLVTGLEATAGLSFLIDFIDPQIARDMYTDLGIAHSYFTAGWTWQDIQNDPSNLIHKIFDSGRNGPTTLDLSASFFNFGIELEF
jgi:hypothetical protein